MQSSRRRKVIKLPVNQFGPVSVREIPVIIRGINLFCGSGIIRPPFNIGDAGAGHLQLWQSPIYGPGLLQTFFLREKPLVRRQVQAFGKYIILRCLGGLSSKRCKFFIFRWLDLPSHLPFPFTYYRSYDPFVSGKITAALHFQEFFCILGRVHTSALARP